MYCIICKKMSDGRYSLKAKDNLTRVELDSTLCNDCYNRLVASHNVKGRFKVHQIFAWSRNKDTIRH